jgi:WD40 repeat protein
MASHPTAPITAYLAGSTVVLYDYRQDAQVAFLSASSPYTPLQPTAGASEATGTLGAGGTTRPRGSTVRRTPFPASPLPLPTGPSTPFTHTLKTLRCLAFSPDGRYLAAGEVGHNPRILVWDTVSQDLVGHMQGHRFGVHSLAFSPNGRYLVSIGFQVGCGAGVRRCG